MRAWLFFQDEDRGALGGGVVIPNGVDTQRFTPSPVPEGPELVFTGTLSWHPNIDGLEWFCTRVFPLVRAQCPRARFTIVGREPLPEVHALARLPGVSLDADVPSVLPHLRRARVAVVPLRVGSGTRLKALEAMAAGRPVVGTTLGLAGLGVDAGRHALVADEPHALAEALVVVLQDDAIAARLATEGARLARDEFSWDVIGRRYVDAVLGR